MSQDEDDDQPSWMRDDGKPHKRHGCKYIDLGRGGPEHDPAPRRTVIDKRSEYGKRLDLSAGAVLGWPW